MKIVYVTAQAPWGKGEAFVQEEVLELQNSGVDLLIIPRNPRKSLFHKEAQQLLANAIWLPLINFRMIGGLLKALFMRASLWKVLIHIIRHSRTSWILIKNLAILPKGVFIANMLQDEHIYHIHAHWGSTTSTMAYVISQLTGIPWSFTLHRWDIRENNILKEKGRSAKFIRCISMHGKGELIDIIGKIFESNIHVIHMGVRVPEKIKEPKTSSGLFTIAVPANLLEVKGHEYLVEASSILLKKGIRNFRCIFYGEGPLRTRLENLTKKRGVASYIEMPGAIAHEELIEMYKGGMVDLAVLPSIITHKGAHEGIPVALMEAMAFGIPVISTNTGGIPELFSAGAGTIVAEKNPEQLAKAISGLLADAELRRKVGFEGYQRVKEEFNASVSVASLAEVIKDGN
ncbi:glycosyltransferase family 4 protein [Chloroflexota bacterium]